MRHYGKRSSGKVISSDVECPLVILSGTPTGDRDTNPFQMDALDMRYINLLILRQFV